MQSQPILKIQGEKMVHAPCGHMHSTGVTDLLAKRCRQKIKQNLLTPLHKEMHKQHSALR